MQLGSVGRFALVKQLGEGGMGRVYLARDGQRQIALKVLDEHRSSDRELVQLFIDEARITSVLDHPNIAKVFEIGSAADRHYLAMEYVDGVDARSLLESATSRYSPVGYEAAIEIVIQAAGALDHAHRRCGPAGPLHIVHRDVSPSNLMLARDGTVKVVDFGIAHWSLSSVHTQVRRVRGKASYMAPEQCRGEAYDHRLDVFGLGIVLYELTTGARCFDGPCDLARMNAVASGVYTNPTNLRDDYPFGLLAVVQRALAERPADRYPSCAAFAQALRAVLRANAWLGGRWTVAQEVRPILFARASAPEIPTEQTWIGPIPQTGEITLGRASPRRRDIGSRTPSV